MINVEFDLAFQTNLLKAILADKDFMKDVSGKLRSTDFGTSPLRLIYEISDRYFRKFGDMITPEILQMEAIGSVNGTNDSYNNTVLDDEFGSFADVLVECCAALSSHDTRNTNYFRDPSKLKRFILTSRIISADSRGLTADKFVEEIDRIQSDAATVNAEGFQFTNPDDFSDTVGESEILYGTGIASIDIPLGGGMDIGQYGILVAPSGVGKSVGMLNFALNNAVLGRHSLTITLENPESMLVSRLNSMMSYIDARNLKKRNMAQWPKDQLERYRFVARKSFPLWNKIDILDFSGASRFQKMQHIDPTLDVIESAIGYWKESKLKEGIPPERCSFVYVDWIESINMDPRNVRNAGKNDNEANLLKKISRELSAIARRTKTIIWTACQTQKGSEDKNVITKKDIAHSTHVVDYCDVCISFALAEAGKQKFLGGGRKAIEQPELSRNLNVSFIKTRDSTSTNTYRTFYQGPSLKMWDRRSDMDDALGILGSVGIEKFYSMMGTGSNDEHPGGGAK